ncbi:MAG: DUF2200 domain-containing protein [Patescibacteria group bacterium]
MLKQNLYKTSFAKVYPYYIAKAERKGRTKAEVDEIIRWFTGYTQKRFESELKKQTDFETFYTKAPKMNPSRHLITGVICGIRLEEITDPLMREIRYLDKLIDELAKGRVMEKILRKSPRIN